MTDREKAIVMAHTGICMLTGDKFQIFHKYVEDIMGRPVWTHEMGNESIVNEIKEKSKDDFIALCADELPSVTQKPETVTEFADRCRECGAKYGKMLKTGHWIPVFERLPEDGTWNFFTDGKMISVERYKADAFDHFYPEGRWFSFDEAVGWLPLSELPKPYRAKVEVLTRGNCMMCGKPLSEDEGLFLCKECEDKIAEVRDKNEVTNILYKGG